MFIPFQMGQKRSQRSSPFHSSWVVFWIKLRIVCGLTPIRTLIVWGHNKRRDERQKMKIHIFSFQGKHSFEFLSANCFKSEEKCFLFWLKNEPHLKWSLFWEEKFEKQSIGQVESIFPPKEFEEISADSWAVHWHKPCAVTRSWWMQSFWIIKFN